MLPGASHHPRPLFAAAACSLSRLAAPMASDGPVARAIRAKLSSGLRPEHLEVHNESHQHAVPPGSESHFRVLVVSSQFEGLPLIQRHRLVNEALREELRSRVHALAIQAKTPEQWGRDPSAGASPACMGGSRGDRGVEEKLRAAQRDDTDARQLS